VGERVNKHLTESAFRFWYNIREYASTLYLGMIFPFPFIKYKTKIIIYELLRNIDPKKYYEAF